MHYHSVDRLNEIIYCVTIYHKYIGHDAHNIVSRSKENNIT